MECRTIYTKTERRRRTQRGFTLVETLIGMGITTLLVLVLCAFSLHSSRSFAALFNYVDLDGGNQTVMDQLSRDIRQAKRLKSCTTNATTMAIDKIVLEDADGTDLIYSYNPKHGTLTRVKAGRARVVLKGCERLEFALGQRNTYSGGYDVYAAASPATCKVINVSWNCARAILGNKQNTESVQTARIVIRKQGT